MVIIISPSGRAIEQNETTITLRLTAEQIEAVVEYVDASLVGEAAAHPVLDAALDELCDAYFELTGESL